MPKSPPDLSKVRKIHVRAPNWLGDLVMSTAAFARIRAAFPQAEITGAMRGYLKPLLTGTNWFDHVVEAPKAGGPRGLWRQVQAMKRAAYDLAIVLPNSLETGLVPFLARVPLRLGYRQGRPFTMTHGLTARVRRRFWEPRQGPRRWPIPMPLYYRELLDVLGLPGDALRPELRVLPEEDAWVQEHLHQRGVPAGAKLVMFVVGANFGSSKLWVPERFAAVAQHFHARRGMASLVLVGPSEVELGRRIGAAAPGAIVLDQPVLPLDKLKALVARGHLMITGDTGPRHIAVAFDRPVVCLMGPNDPNYTNYCLEHQVVIRKDLECMPCQRKVCPLGHHRCMKDITVDEVIAAGERLLGFA
jgi:heptosyltransferase-2